jgi:hypothetical protein
MTEASPCVRVCVIDPVTGWCIGCGRTTQEIGDWMILDDPARRRLKAGLPRRLTEMTTRRTRKGPRHAG